jgi:hypothetical protein
MRTWQISIGMAGALLALAACGGSAEEPIASGTPIPLGPDRWMEDVYANDTSVTLGEMVLPGTHDSGSYAIDVEEPCDIVPAAGTPELITALGTANPCAAAAMYRAQDENLTEQLESGIRYLDLRVSVQESDAKPVTAATAATASATSADPTPSTPAEATVAADEFVLEHEFVSTGLTGALDQILEFAASRPREQIILDFQHIDLADDADTSAYYDALSSLLKEYAPNGAAPVCERAWSADVLGGTPEALATSVTLQDAWDADRNLVVLVPDSTLPESPCYYPRSNAILSQWPNTEDPAASLANNSEQLAQRQQRLAATPQDCSNSGENPSQGDNWCGFFVNQMQLTFQPVTFAECIADTTEACSLFAYSQKVNDTIGPQVRSWAIDEDLPVNIVIVDYYNESDPSFTDTLIEVNRQLTEQGATSQPTDSTESPS